MKSDGKTIAAAILYQHHEGSAAVEGNDIDECVDKDTYPLSN